jgi:hypothetical protein
MKAFPIVALIIGLALLTSCVSSQQQTYRAQAMQQSAYSAPVIQTPPEKPQPSVATSGFVKVKVLTSASSSPPDAGPGNFVHSVFSYSTPTWNVGEATLSEIEKTLGRDEIEPQKEGFFPAGLQARRWNSVTFSLKGYDLDQQQPRPLTLFFDENGVLKGILNP